MGCRSCGEGRERRAAGAAYAGQAAQADSHAAAERHEAEAASKRRIGEVGSLVAGGRHWQFWRLLVIVPVP